MIPAGPTADLPRHSPGHGTRSGKPGVPGPAAPLSRRSTRAGPLSYWLVRRGGIAPRGDLAPMMRKGACHQTGGRPQDRGLSGVLVDISVAHVRAGAMPTGTPCVRVSWV